MSIKYFLAGLVVSVSLVSCLSNDPNKDVTKASPEAEKSLKDTANFTSIQWIDSVKDFGKIQEGANIELTYRFKNTGSKPLVVADVHPGCGCTLVEKPTKPVMPGQEGEIKGSFDTKGRVGHSEKTITVNVNTIKQNYQLSFSVDVEAAKKG